MKPKPALTFIERRKNPENMERARKLWTDVYHGCVGHDHGHIDALSAALDEAETRGGKSVLSLADLIIGQFGDAIVKAAWKGATKKVRKENE